MRTRFDVFISHNSIDKPWVLRLKDALLQRGISVWLDQDEIRPGDLFVGALEQGLDESKAVALVISPESLQSDWVKEEYSRAVSLAATSQRSLQLIPLVYRHVDAADLPGFLAGRNWVDFRDPATFAQSVDRLIWGITGRKQKVIKPTQDRSDSRSERKFRLLHIADLRIGHPRNGYFDSPLDLIDGPWERNLSRLLEEHGPVDAIFVAGNVTNSGDVEQFEAATQFFTRLLEKTGLSRERFFVSPGFRDCQAVCSSSFLTMNKPGLSLALAGLKEPSENEREFMQAFRQSRKRFDRWRRKFFSRVKIQQANTHRSLGERRFFHESHLATNVHAVLLDSVWCCDESGMQAFLGEHQLRMLVTAPDGFPLDGLRICMMQHRISDLSDAAICAPLLTNHVDIVLCGKRGNENDQVDSSLGNSNCVPIITAGCAVGSEHQEIIIPTCNYVTIEFSASGRHRSVSCHTRELACDGSHWFDSSIARFGTQFKKSLHESDEGFKNPFDAWTPISPSRLMGRHSELSQLGSALESGRSVSIVGDWRIGKTSLLQAWAQEAMKRGRVVKLLSGENRDGLSPKDFIESVVGESVSSDSPDDAADLLQDWSIKLGAISGAPLILVDECDGILKRFPSRFFERLRGMLGSILLVLSTRQELDRICHEAGGTSPLHNRHQRLQLGLLESNAAISLSGLGDKYFGEPHYTLIRDYAGRHPFFIQLLGFHLVNSISLGESIDKALDRFRAESAARFRDIWPLLTTLETESLRACASGSPVKCHSLKARGLIDEDGKPFGRVLTDWITEELVG